MMFLLILLFFGIFIFYHFYYKRKDLPPGPKPLPFFGNLFEISNPPPGYDAFLRWRKAYGPIYTYWVGEKPLVAITDYETMVEALIKDGDAYMDRDYFSEFLPIVREGKHGIVIEEGETWKEQKRFLMSVFNNALSKEGLEEKILDEVYAMINLINQDIDSGLAQNYDIRPKIEVCVGSTMATILFGRQFKGKIDPDFEKLKNGITYYMTLIGKPSSQILMYRPYLRKWPYFSTIFEKFVNYKKRMFEFFDRKIGEIKERLDKNDNLLPTSYISEFLQEIEDKRHEDYTMHELKNQLLDLWPAGDDTTTVTLLWGIVYMIHHQDVQQKVQAEIDLHVPKDHPVRMINKTSLPYTSAVIDEIQRLANIMPKNLPHKTTKDVLLGGYKIKKGNTVMPQISVVLYDENIFSRPFEFNPNHFLTSDGQYKKVNELIPFGMGKRSCPGKKIAKTELFLITANLLKIFKISKAENGPLPTLEQEFGLSVHPKIFTCKIVKRQ